MPTPREILNSDLEAAKFRFERREAVHRLRPMSSFRHPTPSELLHAEERAVHQKYYDGLQQLWAGADPASAIGQLAAERITGGSHRPRPLSESIEFDLESGAKSRAAELLQGIGIFFKMGAEQYSSPRAFRAAVRAAAEHGVGVVIGENTPDEWKNSYGMTPSQALALLDGHIRGNADPVFNQILAGHELSAKPAVMPVPPAEGSVANDPQRLVALFPNGKLTRREAREFAARQQVINAGTHTVGEISAMVDKVDAMQTGQLTAAFEQSVQAAQGQMAQALGAIANGALGKEEVDHQATISHHSYSASGSGGVKKHSSSRGIRTSDSHGQERSVELGSGEEQRQIAGLADRVMLGPGAGPAGSFPSLAVVPAQTALGPTGGLGVLRQQAFGNTRETVGGRGRMAASDWREVKKDAARQDLQAGGKFDFQVSSDSFSHVETLVEHAAWNVPPDTSITLRADPTATVEGQEVESFRAAAGTGGYAEVGDNYARASGGDGPVAASHVTVQGGKVTASAHFEMVISREEKS